MAAEGFALLGGRILPAGHNVAALLVYKDEAGNQLSIYVTGAGETKAKGTYTAEEGGPTAIYWLDPRYGCAIVGAMPQERLADVARIAWRQMVDECGELRQARPLATAARSKCERSTGVGNLSQFGPNRGGEARLMFALRQA